MIDLKRYKFLDLGSSKGGSLELGERLFEGKGIGTEIDKNKVSILQAKGLSYIVCDINEIGKYVVGSLKYATAIDFFEHLKNSSEFYKIMKSLSSHIENFIFLMQPFIEHEYLVYENDLNYYWNNWTGHPNLMTVDDFKNYFNHQNYYKYLVIGFRKQLESFNDPVFIPINSPKDSHEYNPDTHSYKKKYKNFDLENKFYKQICCFFIKKNDDLHTIKKICKKLKISPIYFSNPKINF